MLYTSDKLEVASRAWDRFILFFRASEMVPQGNSEQLALSYIDYTDSRTSVLNLGTFFWKDCIYRLNLFFLQENFWPCHATRVT